MLDNVMALRPAETEVNSASPNDQQANEGDEMHTLPAMIEQFIQLVEQYLDSRQQQIDSENSAPHSGKNWRREQAMYEHARNQQIVADETRDSFKKLGERLAVSIERAGQDSTGIRKLLHYAYASLGFDEIKSHWADWKVHLQQTATAISSLKRNGDTPATKSSEAEIQDHQSDTWVPASEITKGYVVGKSQLTKLAQKYPDIRRAARPEDRIRWRKSRLLWVYNKRRIYELTEGAGDE